MKQLKASRLSSQEMNTANQVQILDEANRVSFRAHALGKGLNPWENSKAYCFFFKL